MKGFYGSQKLYLQQEKESMNTSLDTSKNTYHHRVSHGAMISERGRKGEGWV